MRRRFHSLSAGLAAVAWLAGCALSPPPEGPSGTQLAGKVYDSITGDPIPGVAIRFGSLSAESAADGGFSIPLGETGETLVAGWLIFKQDYQFTYVDRVSIDSSRNWQLAIPLRKTDPSGYPAVGALQGDLNFADGNTVPDASALAIDIYGSNGTHSHYECESNGSRYSIDLPDGSSDCLVILRVDPAAGDAFIAMAQDVDLSGPSAVELDFREPLEGFSVVQATASQAGSQATCFFATPYGLVPGWFKGPGAAAEILETWEFSSALPEEVPVYNPFGWQQVFWIQREQDAAFQDLPDHLKLFMSSTALGSFSETVSLPAVDRTLGPDEGAVPTSLRLNGAQLSLEPVAGASLYSFSFKENTAEGRLLGTVLSFECSVMLPDLLAVALGGRSIEVGFEVMDSHLAALGTDLLGVDAGFPANLDIGMVKGSEAAGYERLLDFSVPGEIIIEIE
jgi:hypothetical protein